jgi:hypothetical protein
MPAPIRLRGVAVERDRLDEHRRTVQIEPQIVLRVSVGKDPKFRVVDLTEDEALALAQDTIAAVTRAREIRADREARR